MGLFFAVEKDDELAETIRKLEEAYDNELIGITEAEWDASAKHLVATLDKFKVPEAEQKELLAFVTTLKADIVEKK